MALTDEERRRIEEVQRLYEFENNMLRTDWYADVERDFGGAPLTSMARSFYKVWVEYVGSVEESNQAIIDICEQAKSGAISFAEAKQKISETQHEEAKLKAFMEANNGASNLSDYLKGVREQIGLELQFAKDLRNFLENGQI